MRSPHADCAEHADRKQTERQETPLSLNKWLLSGQGPLRQRQDADTSEKAHRGSGAQLGPVPNCVTFRKPTLCHYLPTLVTCLLHARHWAHGSHLILPTAQGGDRCYSHFMDGGTETREVE